MSLIIVSARGYPQISCLNVINVGHVVTSLKIVRMSIAVSDLSSVTRVQQIMGAVVAMGVMFK